VFRYEPADDAAATAKDRTDEDGSTTAVLRRVTVGRTEVVVAHRRANMVRVLLRCFLCVRQMDEDE
jgi:hypothetical protein